MAATGDNYEAKKTKGRQKIEMKKIENEDDKLITFSKRRSGIYKKSSELVTLTGAELAFVVFSPAGKPFSFAHPSVEAVANRFLGREPTQAGDGTTHHPLVEAHRQMRIEELNQHHNELLRQLDQVKEEGKQLKQKIKGIDMKGWWDTPIEEMNVEEMLKMEADFKDLRLKLIEKLKERTGGASSSSAAVASVGDDPAHLMNSFPISGNDEIDIPPVFPPAGHDYGHGQF